MPLNRIQTSFCSWSYHQGHESPKITALRLQDLSAASDTIDSTLVHRLQLVWLEGYCFFGFNPLYPLTISLSTLMELHLPHPAFFKLVFLKVPFYIGPLLFILYTTPFSYLIFDSSANHHLYADDARLVIFFSAPDFSQNASYLETTIDSLSLSTWISGNLLSLNQSKTEFLLIGRPKLLSKVSDATVHMSSIITINPSDSARNLGVIFDSSLTISDHTSTVYKSCFLFIRDIRRIRSTLDSTTAETIATSLIHSKVDYKSNSLFLNLPRSQLDRLQLILDFAARAVSETPQSTHISPVLRSLHWLKIERIHYTILSITYKTLQSRKPLLCVQSPPYPIGHYSPRSSTTVTLKCPTVSSRLKITNSRREI